MTSGTVYVMEEDDESSCSSDSEIDRYLLDNKDLVENALSVPPQEFLFAPQAMSESVVLPDFACLDPDTQERLQALLQAAGITKVANEGRAFGDPELLKRLTSSVSSALDEAAAALTRMKSEDKCTEEPAAAVVTEVGAAEEGESLLSLACSAGYYELAQVLLAMRTNVEDRGAKGDCTPLMEAASAGHADIVKLLIAHGADMAAQSSTGNTPLMYACASGHEEVVRVLLKAGADVSLHNENGHTPLMEAASAGHVGIARLLVESGAQVNAHSAEFKVGLESPLTLACYKGHLEMVRYLLQVGGDNASPGRQEELHTALMEASMDGHVDVARLLLDAGAQVNLPTDSFESPLTLAACGGHTELATLLLERGANLEEPNDEGYTPLMEAAREGHEETVAVLLDWGAYVDAQTEETGETALTLACCGGFQEVVALLLAHPADIELGANTPLMEAAQEGHLDLVCYLIKRGVNVNASTASGDTPLTYAAENGHTDVCTTLLEAGANLEQAAEGGRTALMKAARAGHFCAVQYLLNKGADPNKSTSNNDHCALSLACGGGHLAVVELLLQHGADPTKKLKDGATCIMEAAKGGHTTVVQLLIDWRPGSNFVGRMVGTQFPIGPGIVPPPPPPPNVNRPSCAEMGSGNLNISSDSLLPQFNLPRGTGSAGATYPNLAIDELASRRFMPEVVINKTPSEPRETEKSLFKEASDKMSAAQMLQWQEMLKAQFQETAAQLANRVQATNTSRSGASSAAFSPSHSSIVSASTGSSTAKSKKAELEAAMKELEQLKKTQQLYEQLQSALEAKDEKAIAAKQQAKNKSKSTSCLQQHPSKKEYALPPVPPPSPPPPPTPVVAAGDQLRPAAAPPPCAVPPTDIQQVQHPNTTPHQQVLPLSFQFDPLDPTHLQYLQQQFSLALSTQNFPTQSFPFQLQNQLNNQAIFANLPPQNVLSDGTVAAQVQNLVATIAADPAVLANNAYVSADSMSTSISPGLVNGASASFSCATVSPPLPNAFNFPLQSSGFNFTPSHLLPPHSPTTGAHLTQQISQTTPETPFVLNNFQQQHSIIYGVAASAVNAKSTQTPILNDPAAPMIGYHPQAGAFHPTGAYSSLVNQSPIGQASVPVAQMLRSTGVDLNTQTESNHDTALTLACAGGHEDLVLLLLEKGADLEHQDKKGFTPLILAATAGHANVVELLLTNKAALEAQSERTKDTALSLACSSGKKEVVEILLNHGSNKEHRNVSDYTPLSLAASGGYTEIISLLLNAQAEINSRTGSKLGISPLMLAAMNGHVQAVKLLLEKGADINAQIETNRNTALTLACFQGRNEVVKLLLEYGANVEHRAKTGLTPLMEAASGGYVEVGRVLLHYGADANSAPVHASRDTALTIAADKGHAKFVELLLHHGAQLDCKTKKGCTALWLACHGGFLEVVQALVKAGANVDTQDNRKVTPLMAAFRKGHLKVVKWLVRHVQQFPSDTECTRYLSTITDKDTLVKCKQCMETIMAAKDRQAQEANKAAAVLLQELEHEQQLAETRRQAKQRQKEKKKAKRKAKKTALNGEVDDKCGDDQGYQEIESNENLEDESKQQDKKTSKESTPVATKFSESSRASSSRSSASVSLERCHNRRANSPLAFVATNDADVAAAVMPVSEFIRASALNEERRVPTCPGKILQYEQPVSQQFDVQQQQQNAQENNRRRRRPRRMRPSDFMKSEAAQLTGDVIKTMTVVSTAHQQRLAAENAKNTLKTRLNDSKNVEHAGDFDGWSKATTHRSNLTNPLASSRTRGRSMGATRTSNRQTSVVNDENVNLTAADQKNNVNWREVKRQSQRIFVSSQSIARVIGRGGNNINAIRESSGAHIEVEKQQKGQTDRLITIRGSSEAAKQAILMINGLINEPETPVADIVSKVKRKDTKAMEMFAQSRGSMSVTQGAPLTIVNSKINQAATTTSSLDTKTNGFPEMTVWDPAIVVSTPAVSGKRKNQASKVTANVKKSLATAQTIVQPTSNGGVTYTTAAASLKTSTVLSSAKSKPAESNVVAIKTTATTPPSAATSTNMEYSPFSTPNVWFNRAPHKMNFASVAAANIAATTTVTTTTTRTSSPPMKCVVTSTMSSHSTVLTTTESSDVPTVGDDQRKAPGYRNKVPPASFLGSGQHQAERSNTDWFAASQQAQRVENFFREAATKSESTAHQVEQPSFPPQPSNAGGGGAPSDVTSGYNSSFDGSTSKLLYGGSQQKTTVDTSLTFDIDGRRSAGVLNEYFSPIALPRPASATAFVSVPDTDVQPPNTNGIFTPPSPVHSNLFGQLGQQPMQSNFALPTPIGGERRSRGPSTVPTAMANVFGDLSEFQQNWDVPNGLSSANGADWSSGFSGLSANLAQLQALQAMSNVQSVDYSYDNSMKAVDDIGGGGAVYDSDFYQPAAMWLAAYHQQHGNSQLPPPPSQHQHQHAYHTQPPPQQQPQQNFRFRQPPSFAEPPPSMAPYGVGHFGVPADPWSSQATWKMINGSAVPGVDPQRMNPASPSGIFHPSSSTSVSHGYMSAGHPPLPQPPMQPAYNRMMGNQHQMAQQPQHGWSGWNSVPMQ